MGYASYREMAPGQTIADFYSHKYKVEQEVIQADGTRGRWP